MDATCGPVASNILSQRRWVVLGTDGLYVTLGRATDPTEDEIQRAETALLARGAPSWLAIMSRSPYGKRASDLMVIRPLVQPQTAFDDAAAAFCRAR